MSNESPTGISDYQFVGDDVVLPFAVESLDVRGRAIQTGKLIDGILKRHDYPQDVSFLLGEMIMLTVILGSSLKFDGNFIMQTQSDGPVSLAVVDYRTPGYVRAYARFDEQGVVQASADGNTSPSDLLGKGVLAMTIDQGSDMNRYQGIVELDGGSLEDAAHQYFRQSEQIPTRVRLSVAQIMRPSGDGGEVETAWRGGALITQFLPDSPGRIVVQDLPGGSDNDPDPLREDDAWVEASSLMATIAEDELTDPQIGSEQLLFRLFNQHGVRVFNGISVAEKCSCSREKVIGLVRSFDAGTDENGETSQNLVTKCEFCSTVYELTEAEIEGK